MTLFTPITRSQSSLSIWFVTLLTCLNSLSHFNCFFPFVVPPVLWCCWLGGRKGIQPVKNLSGGMLAWLFVWSEVQTCMWPSWCHCHSLSLASVKSRLVLPFWYWLVWVVPEKGPLNGCVCVCVFSICDIARVFRNGTSAVKFCCHLCLTGLVRQDSVQWTDSSNESSLTWCVCRKRQLFHVFVA